MHFLKWNGICLLLLLPGELFGADKQEVKIDRVPTLRSIAFKVVHTQLSPDFAQMKASCPALLDQAEAILIKGDCPESAIQIANLLTRVQACGVAFKPSRNCRNDRLKHFHRAHMARRMLDFCEYVPLQVTPLVQWITVPVEAVNGKGSFVFHDLVHLAIIGLSKPRSDNPNMLGYENSTACIADLLEKRPGDIWFDYKNKSVWELARQIPEGSSSSAAEIIPLLNIARKNI